MNRTANLGLNCFVDFVLWRNAIFGFPISRVHCIVHFYSQYLFVYFFISFSISKYPFFVLYVQFFAFSFELYCKEWFLLYYVHHFKGKMK